MRDAGHRTPDAGHRTAKKAKIIYPPPRGVDIISLTVSRDLKLLENNLDFNENSIFNIDITILEVQKALLKSKNGKATGLDNLPYELFKNETSLNLLTCLFKHIYNTGEIPSQ